MHFILFKQVAEAQFFGSSGDIVLWISEKTWKVQFKYDAVLKKLILTGVKDFLEDNRLEEGDCCVLEKFMVGSYDVKIFRDDSAANPVGDSSGNFKKKSFFC